MTPERMASFLRVGATDLADDLLVRGLDDWVMLSEVEYLVRRITPDAGLDQVIRETAALVETLSSAGLVEVGDVQEQSGFVAWSLSPAETAARIRSEWSGLGRSLEMGDICWLANTAGGDEKARRVSQD